MVGMIPQTVCLLSAQSLDHCTINGSFELSPILIARETVLNGISQLKPGKCDGSARLSHHFIYAKEVLSNPISKPFTAMLCHGIVPDPLCDCILVPIPKSGKDPSSSESYRPIVLTPTLSNYKVFEW